MPSMLTFETKYYDSLSQFVFTVARAVAVEEVQNSKEVNENLNLIGTSCLLGCVELTVTYSVDACLSSL
jgi:hypothetical protein